MRLSEYKGEQALDMLADLIEPVATIMADPEIARIARSGQPQVKIIKPAIKNHKKEVIEILAILERENPSDYASKVNLLTLPVKLLEILNDPDLMNLFTSQGQTKDETNSGSATENIEESEQ